VDRWWIIGIAIADRTSGGTGVGPGAKRYFLSISYSPLIVNFVYFYLVTDGFYPEARRILSFH
jgi:hypothetical protein